MKQERLGPGWAWTKKFNLVVGIKVGDTVYTSGLVSIDSDGNVVDDDVYSQSVQILKNIKNVLKVGAGSMSDIVKINTFLTNMSHYGEFSKARNEVLRLKLQPAPPTEHPLWFYRHYWSKRKQLL